jgi:hypothetical protein
LVFRARSAADRYAAAPCSAAFRRCW